ncbi:LysM peptidoglycan-binding domain-containing protein [Jiulongibacter sediminis]|jgi:LysM repeat protein|uniref:lytic transglycosylase n=1 Tax=Jiulongibacter sediminis TaxID=1605367 RepID=UPI0026F17F2D|nr:LysM peptidoglycan-binding domain-containing protein [Jiulongibacter sediminis]
MEFEKRNPKPEEASKNLPMAVLISLVGIVCLLLYVGWQMISDEASTVAELDHPEAVVVREEPIANKEDVATASSEPIEEVPIAKVEETVKAQPAMGDAKMATHTISKGETLFSIANRYNISVSTLQSYNDNISANSLSVGKKLTVPVMAIHTVGPGDILRVVGGKYGITVDALMKANGKTKNYAERGEKLIIPFKENK